MAASKRERVVSDEDVRAVAELARLRPDEDAVARLTDELNGILEHVRLLETLDLSGLEDGLGEASLPMGFRDPVMGPDELSAESMGDLAPDWREGFFVVPRLPALDQEGVSLESDS